MAVTVTKIFQGTDISISDVIATADGDTAAVVPHGLANVPAEVYVTPMLSQALAASSAWIWDPLSLATVNIHLTKLASTGSGNAAVQVRCIAKSPQAPGAPNNAPPTAQQPMGI